MNFCSAASNITLESGSTGHRQANAVNHYFKIRNNSYSQHTPLIKIDRSVFHSLDIIYRNNQTSLKSERLQLNEGFQGRYYLLCHNVGGITSLLVMVCCLIFFLCGSDHGYDIPNRFGSWNIKASSFPLDIESSRSIISLDLPLFSIPAFIINYRFHAGAVAAFQ